MQKLYTVSKNTGPGTRGPEQQIWAQGHGARGLRPWEPGQHLEFPRETGLILRCAGKAENPFQTTQGNRLSCRDQEGRKDPRVPHTARRGA